MRKGFSLVTAIMMMLLIAVVGTAILSLSNMTVEQKGQAFMRLQTELAARGAAEYAIKDMLFNPNSMPADLRSGKQIYINTSQYNIKMDIRFVGGDIHDTSPEDIDYTGVMLIDTAVETTIADMPIRYVKRTIQLP